MEEFKIKIRIMKDTKNMKWWAEEFIGGRWIEISETKMSCEGNTRNCVARYVKKKKDEYYKLFVEQVGEELEFDLEI